MTNPTTDPYSYDAAAYVLGALEPDERADFERHFATCPACSAAVAELRDLPALLALVDESDVTAIDSRGETAFETGPVPDTLLPRMLRSQHRTHRRRFALAAGGAIAACAASVLITSAVVSSPSTSTPAGHALHAVVASPVTASAAFTAKTWGTEITLKCRYATGQYTPMSYTLRVTDRTGATQDLGTWSIAPGKTITFHSGTSLASAQIKQLAIVTATGMPILELAT